MKSTVVCGYIGLGRRGGAVLKDCVSKMSDVKVKYLCDQSQSRMEESQRVLKENGGYEAILTKDYHQILADPEVDCVMVMTGWGGRPQIAKEALLAHKYAGIEVGCSNTVEECFELLKVYEQTKTPLMMLENCCYGRREMLALQMHELGLFGEIVHCKGAYRHNLLEVELFKDIDQEEIPHYRLKEYETKNRENYPTHELGPISKLLKIHRGNRMVSLRSVSSKACGIKTYAAHALGEDSTYAQRDYLQGDIVTTLITCANGETVQLELDTTLPRPYYSRDFTVRGSEGMLSEEGKLVYLYGMERKITNNEDKFYEKYDHPLHREFQAEGPEGGHGGMDWLVCRAFFESVKNGTETPISAYDSLLWMSIGALSEQSIRQGGTAVEIPDFTGGKWEKPAPALAAKYSLDTVVDDPATKIFASLTKRSGTKEFS